jgi:hypothetical protein
LTLIAAAMIVSPASADDVRQPQGWPKNRFRPRIVGQPQAGAELRVTRGDWTFKPVVYEYRWFRCPSAQEKCRWIAGARRRRYIASRRDVGATLRVTVTAKNAAGFSRVSSRRTRVVVPATVVARWSMDETTGSTMIDSVGTHDGTLHSVGLGLPGFRATSYGFNGSSSYVDVASAAALNPGNADIIFTIHVKTTGAPPPPPGDWDLFRKGLHQDGGEYKMELQSTGQASCGFLGTGGYTELAAGPAINNGQWHTISCVKTATAIEVVVDGQIFSKAATVGSISNTGDVIIGALPGLDWYQGQLDEASIQIG